jgi:hypothetical protein
MCSSEWDYAQEALAIADEDEEYDTDTLYDTLKDDEMEGK